jgi:uncharacterized membrane protein YccC
MDEHTSPRLRGSLIAGALLLITGFLFLLSNFDVIGLGPLSHYWPMIIIAIGTTKIFTAEDAVERRKGSWWILIGCWLLVSTVHVFGLSFHNSWPLLLIILGVNSIWKALQPQSEERCQKGCHYAN